MRMQIVFFGSSPFSCVVLEKLVLSAKGCVLGVVTTPDKPVGRHLKITPNPVKVLAQKNNIPVFDNIKDFLDKYRPDCIGLVAAYGRIIGPKTLGKLNGQVFGIHPSLLPKYRGPSPLSQQILDGITETGVTVFKIDLGEDTGPIVAAIPDKILPDDTTISLGNRLFALGIDLIINSQFSIFNQIPISQCHNEATFTKKLTRQDGFLPWEEFNKLITDSTHSHHDPRLLLLFRAHFPWPGVWTLAPDGKRVKLNQVTPFLSLS